MAPAVVTSPPVESSDHLQASALPPNSDAEQEVCAVSSQEQDVSRSRSASREPAVSPEKSHRSEASDEGENAASPVKPLPRIESPADGGEPSQANASPPRSSPVKEQSRFVCTCLGMAPTRVRSSVVNASLSYCAFLRSKSPEKRKDSVSPEKKKRRSKTRSPARRRRSRSARRKRTRSKSRPRTHRSRTRSPARKRRSRSPNVRGRRRSKSQDRSKRSRSRSAGRRKRSRSGDRSRRSRSRSSDRRRRSRSRGRGRRPVFRSRSFDRRDRWKREPSHSPVLILRKQRRSGSRTRRSTSKTPPRLTELGKAFPHKFLVIRND